MQLTRKPVTQKLQNDRLTVAGLSGLQTLLSSDEKAPGHADTSIGGK
jgi:hypothetical protein